MQLISHTAEESKRAKNTILAKSKRANWVMKDEPGELKQIHKKDLIVDATYQRNAVDFKIASLAREWSWLACGVLIVARRKKDLLFVVDGQHRKLAADKREDISFLPCIIFDVDDIAQEAGGFLAANTNRKPLSSVDKFVALTIVKEPSAVLANELLLSANRRVANYSYPTTCNIVGVIVKLIDYDKELFLRIWPIFVKLSDQKPMSANLLGALFTAEKNLPKGTSLALPKWQNSLMLLGADRLLAAIRDAKVYHGKGGEKIAALGLIKALNQGQRSKLSTSLG